MQDGVGIIGKLRRLACGLADDAGRSAGDDYYVCWLVVDRERR
jgi:hypothetical protein